MAISDRDNAVLNSICGILFFGVPNQGMNVDHLCTVVQGKPNEEMIRSLSPKSGILKRLHDDFCNAFPFQDSEVYSFFETNVSKTAVRVSLLTLSCCLTFHTHEPVRKTINSC